MVIEKQPEERHYSNTRMSGGGFHSPRRDADPEALKDYAKAMFSGENLPNMIEGEQPDFSDELAAAWARHAPENEDFMRGLDPLFKTVSIANAAFPHFPGAARSGYAVVKSTYTGTDGGELFQQEIPHLVGQAVRSGKPIPSGGRRARRGRSRRSPRRGADDIWLGYGQRDVR